MKTNEMYMLKISWMLLAVIVYYYNKSDHDQHKLYGELNNHKFVRGLLADPSCKQHLFWLKTLLRLLM